MGERECKVFYKALNPSKAREELLRHKKYVDGIAFDDENISILRDLISVMRDVYGKDYEVVLIGSKNTLMQALDALSNEDTKVLVALDNLGDLDEFIQKCGDYENIELGITVVKPAINLTHLIKHKVKFAVMPPTLIRGRLISEAKARKISIIANPVNDIATYARLLELGVNAIITTDPTIKREARKILKL